MTYCNGTALPHVILFSVLIIMQLSALDLNMASVSGQSGALYIRLDLYRQQDSFHCDTGLWKLNINNDRCDPYFIIAVTPPAGRPSLGSFESQPVDNAHQTLQFGATVAQLANPLVFPFADSDGLAASASAQLEIQVTVKDHDPHTEDELMDRFILTLPVANLSTVGPATHALTGTIRGDQLVLDARLACRPGRYGRGCGVACSPQLAPGGQGGYGCDRATGQRVCLEGFLGPDTGCVRPDHCALRPCANGGRCVNSDAGRRCRCPEGFGGPDCRRVLRPCQYGGGADSATPPPPACVRGVCVELGADLHYGCVCQVGFQGELCDQDFDECGDGGNSSGATRSPCRNGASCVNTIGSFACRCPAGFAGRLCELPPMVMPESAAAVASDGADSAMASAGVSGSTLTPVLACVIAGLAALLLAVVLALLLRRYRRRLRKSPDTTASWHRRRRPGPAHSRTGGVAEVYSEDPSGAYEAVDTAGPGGQNPYEIDEAEEAEDDAGTLDRQNFPNSAYAMSEEAAPPPPPPPPRIGHVASVCK